MKKIILATGNAGKINELQALLSPMECISQHSLGIDEIEETGLTFVENAILKARHASTFSGDAALADDSGLVVPALQGQPGIFSARFAGETATDNENINHLLKQMAHLPIERRQAFFYCVIVLFTHPNDPIPLITTGKLHGIIADEPTGTKGFGYDPIFYLPEFQCTLAELPLDKKNKISHRAAALQQFIRLKAQHDN